MTIKNLIERIRRKKMPKLHGSIALLVTFIMLLSMGGCGGGSKENNISSKSNGDNEEMSESLADHNQDDQSLEELSIVLDWYPNAIHTFIYTAIEEGFYAEEGLKIKILYPANPNDGITMPAAGRADIGMYYPHDILIAIANENVPLKSIGAVCQQPLNVVIAPAENNINSPDDLEGKTLGYPSHEITELFIKSMRTSEGKSLEHVELQDIGFDILTAMTSGQVDATSGGMVNHEVPVLEDKGIPVTYFYPTDYGVPSYYEMVFVTGEDTLAKKKSQLAGFLRASKRGFDVVKEDPKEQ